MPFHIIREDITRVRADAIVNTANPEPIAGRGSDQGIYHAAGYEKLLKARRKIGTIAVGEAAVTNAFRLPAKYIIHTVGPVWQGGSQQEEEALSSCYRKSLLLARQLGCRSIAFPLISAGNDRFPKEKALEIALREIRTFLRDDSEEEMNVTLAVFNRAVYRLSEEMTGPVRAYIDEKYISAKREQEYGAHDTEVAAGSVSEPEFLNSNVQLQRPPESVSASMFSETPAPVMESPLQAPAAPVPAGKRKAGKRKKLSDLKKQVGESYQQCLLRLIDENGCTDAEVYKKANIDRRLFSKIRSNPSYRPKKQTALALALALELNLDETVDLIGRAGIALSDASLFDIIIEYCIENRIYDLFTVNAILFEYDQPLLGQ